MKNNLLALFALFAVAITAPQVQAQITMGCPATHEVHFTFSGQAILEAIAIPHASTVPSPDSISFVDFGVALGTSFARFCHVATPELEYDASLGYWQGTLKFRVHSSNGLLDSCYITLIGQDSFGPTMNSQDITVALNGGTATVFPNDVLTAAPVEYCRSTNVVTQINGQSFITYTSADLGVDTVTVTSTDDLGNTTTVRSVVTVTVGSSVQQLTAADWRVYPNPVGEVLYVDLGSRGLAEEKDLRLSLRAVDGREIWTAALPEGSQISEWQLPASLPQGAYFLHLSGKNASGVMKLMR